MYRYILKRIFWLLPILLGVTFIVFTILYLSPGDAATMILGEQATEEALERLRNDLGLNDPFIVQFFRYAGDVFLRLDLGRSFVSNRVVLTEILSRLPNTLRLASFSIIFASILGITLGVLAARFPQTWIDNVVMGFALFGVSMPTFWQGLILIIVFSLNLGWFPSGGFTNINQMILPVVALSTVSMGNIARITRSSMIDVLDQDYIRTARSKGLSQNIVVNRHALRNALIPVITVIGLQFGALMGGAVLTESVFSINGLGVLMVNSIRTRDIMMVQGSVLFIAFVFAVVNLFVDIMYAYIDPRIRAQYK